MANTAYWEVRQKANSTLAKEAVKEMAKEAIARWVASKDSREIIPIPPGSINLSKLEEFDSLESIMEHIESIALSDDVCQNDNNEIDRDRLLKGQILVYTLCEEGAATETMQHESEELSVASHIILPAVEYHGLWESLYFEGYLKMNLLKYFETAITFAEKKVDTNIISLNKVILLHGPPGTGKTSLCRALVQKAAIRLGDKYSSTELIEIHSHSLFSKWFSESGKLVMKLFDEIRRLLENPKTLVCVLIDEIESLTHARKTSANGNEPSDALRVVNAILTQLDQIKRYPNVMVLATSNVTEVIDSAFLDRVDFKQFIGHPETSAIYDIYKSCISELIRAGLIKDKEITVTPCHGSRLLSENALRIKRLASDSAGLSGRALRKIPFLAYAMYFFKDTYCILDFLESMDLAIDHFKKSESLLSQ